LRKCSLALSSSPFKEELKEIFESVMDFEGDIVDYSLGEMLERVFKTLTPDPSPDRRGEEGKGRGFELKDNLLKYIKAFDSTFLNYIFPLKSPIK
jgi:hypothetical protein